MKIRHKFAPLIIVDYEYNTVKVSGRMIIMNDDDFFKKLKNILDVLDDFELIIDIEYFNTFSFKMVYTMFFNEKIKCIRWVFEIDDEDTVTKGNIVKKELSTQMPSIEFTFSKKPEIK